MKRIPLLLIASLLVLSSASSTASAAVVGQLTEQNWRTHPAIVAIRKLVASIDDGMKKKSYKTEKREFESCGDQYYTLRRIARDAKGIVWYENYFQYEDGSFDFNQYYDQTGRLRFVFATARHANGTREQHRIYFDETGKRIWESKNLVQGPGCPGCFINPYPDSELPFDAAKAFANTGGCIELKPRRKM